MARRGPIKAMIFHGCLNSTIELPICDIGTVFLSLRVKRNGLISQWEEFSRSILEGGLKIVVVPS